MSKANAVHALKLLGTNPYCYDLFLRLLGKDNLTYADIGTTKEEVEHVMKELRYLHYYNLDCNFPWRQPMFSLA
jgi:hypothetical protein